MTPKQRVHAALRREPVDRVPIFMWFHPGTRRLLADELELPPALVDVAMGNDVKMTWVNNNYAMEGIVHERDGEWHVDEWGIQWVRQGAFNQIAESPLQDASRDEVLAYRFPVEHKDKLIALMEPLVPYRDEYFIGCDVSPVAFELYWRLRGMELTMFELAADPELSETMLTRCVDFSVMLSQMAIERYEIDWLWSGDDVAGQQGMMLSPELWRDVIKPRQKRVFDVGRQAGKWVAHHCCGGLRPIIPDLIEIGLDVLNPVQCNCPGMDPLSLKAEFGDRLAFMGGVDTQGVLPGGSAADVRRATRHLIDGMTTDGGGFILAASHTVPPETPMENIFAMYHEAGLPREQILDTAADLRAAS